MLLALVRDAQGLDVAEGDALEESVTEGQEVRVMEKLEVLDEMVVVEGVGEPEALLSTEAEGRADFEVDSVGDCESDREGVTLTVGDNEGLGVGNGPLGETVTEFIALGLPEREEITDTDVLAVGVCEMEGVAELETEAREDALPPMTQAAEAVKERVTEMVSEGEEEEEKLSVPELLALEVEVKVEHAEGEPEALE